MASKLFAYCLALVPWTSHATRLRIPAIEGGVHAAENKLQVFDFANRAVFNGGPRLKVSHAGEAGKAGKNVKKRLGFKGADQVDECGVIVPYNSSTNLKQRCPNRCPLWAEASADDHCNFQCVESSVEACKELDPSFPVPDRELGICRACIIYGCDTCDSDGSERCAVCSPGFHLRSNGSCTSKAKYVWLTLFSVVAFVVILIASWIVDLARRDGVNPKGLRQGLTHRSRSKLQKPRDEQGEQVVQKEKSQRVTTMESDCPKSEPSFCSELQDDTASLSRDDSNFALTHDDSRMALGQSDSSQNIQSSVRAQWPLQTNLLQTNVAGVGVLLHFRFQWMVIVWGAGVAVVWSILAGIVDTDLFRLGLRQPETPRQDCIMVAWGWDTQHRLMWVKVAFLATLYVVSTLLAILHSIRQLRMHQEEDANRTSHKDFSAVLGGIPIIQGSDHAEKELQNVIEDLTGETVLGVSICWDYVDHQDKLMSILEHELTDREFVQPTLEEMEMTRAERSGFWGKMINGVENLFLSPTTQRFLTRGRNKMKIRRRARHSVNMGPTTRGAACGGRAGRADQAKKFVAAATLDASNVQMVNVESMLDELKTASQAYVVFTSEASRDLAVSVAEKKGGVQIRGTTASLKECTVEPYTIMWKNCTNTTTAKYVLHFTKGICVILASLALWVCVFYVPYAYFSMSFSYAYGQEPSAVHSVTFSMLVVMGNLAMYVICSEVADYMHFRSVDTREVCYILLYCFACSLNVMLDLAVTYLICYRMQVGHEMHTHDGRPLAEVHSFTDRIETYAMQKALGSNLFFYAFPSTFLIPFLLEPLLTIIVPFKVMCLIIRTHPKIRGQHAESYLGPTPFDMSRYADILVNINLAVLILFFPGGFILPMFGTLAVSHLWIYCYDHYRILRTIPSCEYASMEVDWCAQWLLTVPCGLLLSCAVYKYHIDSDNSTQGMPLIRECFLMFLVHVFLHTLILVFIVPLGGRKKSVQSTETYRSCSSRIACSWFSANPINCLRSQYKYGHDPPCDYFMAGKEHLLRVNESIGLYFNDTPVPVEDFDSVQVGGLVKEFSQRAFKSIANLPRRWTAPAPTPAQAAAEETGGMPSRSKSDTLEQQVEHRRSSESAATRARSAGFEQERDATPGWSDGGAMLPKITERPSPEASPRT